MVTLALRRAAIAGALLYSIGFLGVLSAQREDDPAPRPSPRQMVTGHEGSLFITSENCIVALVASIVLVVVQGVLVNAIQPKMMQESLGLHPILLFLGLLVGVQLAGLWGALFGVPILAVIVILVNHWLDIYSPEDAAARDLAEQAHQTLADRDAGRGPAGPSPTGTSPTEARHN